MCATCGCTDELSGLGELGEPGLPDHEHGHEHDTGTRTTTAAP